MRKMIRTNQKQKEQDPNTREKTLAGKGWVLSWLQCKRNMQGRFLRGVKRQMPVNTQAPRGPHQALKA